MAINIRDKVFEVKLEKSARNNPIKTTKHRLLMSIADAAIDVANARGVSIGQIIDEMTQQTAKAKNGKAAAA